MIRFYQRHAASVAVSLLVLLAACGSTSSLVVRPTTPAAAELVPTPRLEQFSYRRLLALAPDSGVTVAADITSPVVRERDATYYVGKLEKLLLSQGFEMISPDVVARAGSGKAVGATGAARALAMGKETKADAVLVVQSISVVDGTKYYDVSDATEVEPSNREQDDDGAWHRKDTGACIYTLPFFEVRLEGKLIDARTGDVLWVGAGRQSTLDALKESWNAKLNDNCEIEEETPFIYSDELVTEATLDRTVAGLLDRMFTPLKKAALAGKPIVDEPKVVVAPEMPKELEALAPKLAVVSATNASLREAPEKKGKGMKKIPRKAKVEVVETMGEWIKVKVQDGTVGWMHESSLILPD